MANKKLVYLFPCLAEKRKKVLKKIEQEYPEVKIVPILCAGRFNTDIALKLINDGADGVVMLGCEPGDCHYREGSAISERRFLLVKHSLKAFGFHGERFQIMWHKPSEMKSVMKELSLFMEKLDSLEKEGVEE